MNCLEIIGAVSMMMGICGLLWAIRLNDRQVDPLPPACPICKDTDICDHDTLCPKCSSFIENLRHCKFHNMVYEGSECPKCKYSDYLPKV